MKRIGIISDIHRYLSGEAHNALRGCDYILCAGDSETQQVIMELDSIAPTIAVRGNCDRYDLGPGIDAVASPKIEDVRFKMVHRFEDLVSIPEDVRVVITGHTHVPKYLEANGVIYLNPGSPTRPRGGSLPGLGIMVVDKGEVVSYERIDLPTL